MTYSNFSQRVSGKFYLPEDRVKILRDLEQKVRESRASFKKKARRREQRKTAESVES